ncbi:hypothetical protein [Methylobacterium radiodurans]|uniref:Uncharacterized protein n=1 Tax=Methylobacterium radiodurans TaxID=2202828 RepID=A0A2U8VNN1_9HYPH|nr:hypothetical protein [Methylobacterium radiodurans]AWN34986.1 hypothetical protein DK427_03850 [Methylobacterium radiodurans]
MRAHLALGLLLLGASPLGAADLLGRPPVPAGAGPRCGAPRYFPRGEGDEVVPRCAAPIPAPVGCVPRRVPVPTNAPGDPSYVGSAYGLGKPSYYGFTPPLGWDDPFDRAVLPYCP